MENKRDRKLPDEGLDRTVQRHLGQRLRAQYEEVLRGSLPERVRELLDQMDDEMASCRRPGEPLHGKRTR